MEEDLGQYLDVDDDDVSQLQFYFLLLSWLLWWLLLLQLVQEECTELEGLKRVPMAYEEPAGLWWNPAETGSDQTKCMRQ